MTAPTRAPSARTRLRFRPPRFGLSGSPIGELPSPDGDAVAAATLDAAYGAGIRFFVTAPEHGDGRSEERFGTALAGHPRGDYLLATRLEKDLDAEGVRRSLTGSLARLGVDRVDLVLIPDPGDAWQQLVTSVYPALGELREEGLLGRIGAAMDDWRLLDRLVRDTEIDAVLLSGQYSLLDQSATPLLDRCEARGVAVVVAGVLTPVVLGTETTDAAAIRARRISAVCERYGVSLPQAALAFPSRHSAVTSVLIGAASPAEIRADAALVRQRVPPELWRDPELSRLLSAAAG